MEGLKYILFITARVRGTIKVSRKLMPHNDMRSPWNTDESKPTIFMRSPTLIGPSTPIYGCVGTHCLLLSVTMSDTCVETTHCQWCDASCDATFCTALKWSEFDSRLRETINLRLDVQILLVITSDGSYQRTQADSFSLSAGAKFCCGIQ